MGLNSKISWTDHTINLWWGCSKVHTGCKNCYAEYLSDVRYKGNLWGENASRRIVKSAFDKLTAIQLIGKETGVRQRVFVGSMMDIFENDKPVVDAKGDPVFYHVDGKPRGMTTQDLRERLFYGIHSNMYDMIEFQLLTKRPENVMKSLPAPMWNYPASNVMIGASVSNQETYWKMMNGLSSVPFKTFLSVEPMVGPVSIENSPVCRECGSSDVGSIDQGSVWFCRNCNGHDIRLRKNKQVDWIICGGESGQNKRKFDLNWAYALKAECKIYGIPFFFKQIDKVQEIPDDLLIREFP